MLKEARIVMPYDPNQGARLSHERLRDALVRTFGGYTRYVGSGAWFADGKTHDDHVCIYDVAIEAERDASWDQLFQIAMRAGRELNQQAVYIRYPDGMVSIENVHDIGLAPPKIEAPKVPLGTKATPKVGELWNSSQGDLVAVVSTSTKVGGGFNVVILQLGASNSSWKPGASYVTDLDGCVLPDKSSHPRDLKRFVKNF